MATLGLELQELKAILAAEGEQVSDQTPLRDIIKNPVGHSVFSDGNAPNTVQVIGPDLFKDITERHFIFEAWRTHQWLKYAWGVPDEDAKFQQQMHALFQGERHENYLNTYLNTQDFLANPDTAGMHIDIATVPPPFVFGLHLSEPDCCLVVPYFEWGVPFGAPVDIPDRGLVVVNAVMSHHKPDPNAPTFRDLMPLAPNSYALASMVFWLNTYKNQPNTVKDEHALLSPFFDYNAFALNYFYGFADKQPDFDEATREEILRKSAALEPDYYFNLGDFLLKSGRPDEAADAYRKAAATGSNQVLFANCILPLVQYDFDHGKSDEAEAMAKRAADVFSYDGIQTYVWLLCKLNRFDEAEDWVRKLDERYNAHELSYFYAANAAHYPDQFAAEVTKRFPNGFATVSMADFKDAPKDGCLFQTDSDEFQRAGLKAGDIVVALDSHPVHSSDTYTFVRSMSDAPTMDLIIWRNGQYSEVKASPPNRRFGNQINDYKP